MTIKPKSMVKSIPMNLKHFLTLGLKRNFKKIVIFMKLSIEILFAAVYSTSNAKKAMRLLPMVSNVQLKEINIRNSHTMLNSFIILDEKKQCSREWILLHPNIPTQLF